MLSPHTESIKCVFSSFWVLVNSFSDNKNSSQSYLSCTEGSRPPVARFVSGRTCVTLLRHQLASNPSLPVVAEGAHSAGRTLQQGPAENNPDLQSQLTRPWKPASCFWELHVIGMCLLTLPVCLDLAIYTTSRKWTIVILPAIMINVSRAKAGRPQV